MPCVCRADWGWQRHQRTRVARREPWVACTTQACQAFCPTPQCTAQPDSSQAAAPSFHAPAMPPACLQMYQGAGQHPLACGYLTNSRPSIVFRWGGWPGWIAPVAPDGGVGCSSGRLEQDEQVPRACTGCLCKFPGCAFCWAMPCVHAANAVPPPLPLVQVARRCLHGWRAAQRQHLRQRLRR